jgi:hypothetical protein
MKEKNSKVRKFSIALALVLVVGIAIFLVACGGNNDNGNSNDGNSNTGQVSEEPSQSGNAGSGGNYDGLFLGWGSNPEDLNFDAPKASGRGFLDANIYLRYISDNWRIEGFYSGQKLTLVDSGTEDPNLLAQRSKKESEGVYRLVPEWDNGVLITFKNDAGEETNLFETGPYGVYYSTESGVLTLDEFEALNN